MPRRVVKQGCFHYQIQVAMAKRGEKCCGNCFWFENEDAEGAGWCIDSQKETSCDLVCDNHKNR